jgi:dTDP-4-dehydrorhamnose 3,5-epimerase
MSLPSKDLMTSFEVEKFVFEGLALITPKKYEDERGYFMQSYSSGDFKKLGIVATFVQDNLSRSKRGVLRGLHYQLTHPQGKLIQVLKGEVFDVVVDLRRSKPTFGRSLSLKLNSVTGQQLWVPTGFAHGFYVLSPWALVLYKVTDIYDPNGQQTIIWNDSRLSIQWPLINRHPLLSAKDAIGISFGDAPTFE